jgi:hypothetical protein
VEQKQQHIHYDEFTEQFVSLLSEHWPDILLIINRQSPRLAFLLNTATPVNLKRLSGTWRIQIIAKRIPQREGLQPPRDNEIVAQAIRLWAHTMARLRLPRVTIEFTFS